MKSSTALKIFIAGITGAAGGSVVHSRSRRSSDSDITYTEEEVEELIKELKN